jgi:small-conductance mechanosensitive channel
VQGAGELPPKPRHTRPRDWRLAEENRLIKKKDALERKAAALEAFEIGLETREAEQNGREGELDEAVDAVEKHADRLELRQRQVEDVRRDVEAAAACIEGLADGRLDVIETDKGERIKRAADAPDDPDTVRIFEAMRAGGAYFRQIADRVGRACKKLCERADEKAKARLMRQRSLLEQTRNTLTSFSRKLSRDLQKQIMRGVSIPLLQAKQAAQACNRGRGDAR